MDGGRGEKELTVEDGRGEKGVTVEDAEALEAKEDWEAAVKEAGKYATVVGTGKGPSPPDER